MKTRVPRLAVSVSPFGFGVVACDMDEGCVFFDRHGPLSTARSDKVVWRFWSLLPVVNQQAVVFGWERFFDSPSAAVEARLPEDRSDAVLVCRVPMAAWREPASCVTPLISLKSLSADQVRG